MTITKITTTYNRSGGCWTIQALDAKGSLVAIKHHYGLARQAKAYGKRMIAIVTLCQWAQGLVEG